MAARGMFFGEGPMACPFVALESDRDRRSDEPDHRHRCYAEPDPAPRALAHQRSYCLSAAFTTCPIFQDWAIRAAATPVPLRPGRMGDTERDENPVWAAPPPWSGDAAEEDAAGQPAENLSPEQPSAEPPAEALPAAAMADARSADVGSFIAPPERSAPNVERVPSREAEPPEPELREPEAEPPEPEPEEQEVPLPAFLASRADQLPPRRPAERDRSAAPAGQLPQESLRREDVVPPWGRQPIGQTRSRLDLGDAGGLLSKITTMLAIGAILALAVVVVILAPSLLGFDGGAPPPTAPAGGVVPSPTIAVPSPRATPQPTPSPEPRTYRVQAGDTLFSIARRNGITVEQLLAANPQITNPNLVQIGHVLTIPDDDFGLFSPSPDP